MITYDEVVAALYLMEITADLIVFETNQKIVHDYITQQQTKDRRLKKIEELLRLHKYYTDYNLFPSKVVERMKELEEELE